MKKIITLLVFLCLPVLSPLVSLSQSKLKIDSLINEFKTAKEDTNKTKLLSYLSKNLLTNDPDKSFDYANQLYALAEKLNSKKYIINAYQTIAGYYYFKGDLKLAETYSLKAIPLIEQTKNKFSLCSAYGHLSNIARRKNDYLKAIDYSDKALTLAEELKDSFNMILLNGNRGIIYLDFSDYEPALNYFFKALKIAEAINDKEGIANNYFNIGQVYWFQRNNEDKAIHYFQLSLKAANESNDQFQIAQVLKQIGEIYENKNELDNALMYFQKALGINLEIEYVPGISACYRNIGRIYSDKGEFDEAIRFTLKALEQSKKAGDQFGTGNAYVSLGEINMKKKDYKIAVNYLTKGLKVAQATGQRNNESDALFMLAESYKMLHDYKLSSDYYSKYNAVKDSIINEAAIRKTVETEARYGFEKKEKEIALINKDKEILQKDKEVQKMQINFLIRSFIIGAILIAILIFLAFYIYRARQQLKLQTLRNKIASDLHDDIGSTLSSISVFSQIARQESKEVQPMLDHIGEYSRKMLDSMADIVWTINPENDNFEKIIIRMRAFAYELLGAKSIDFEFSVDDPINSLKLPMNTRKNLYLIFKEATNNLVKYSEADTAIFSITGSKNNLMLLIRDNGKGFDMRTQAQGNGLKNMKNRALAIGAKILIESELGKGTTIQLIMKAA